MIHPLIFKNILSLSIFKWFALSKQLHTYNTSWFQHGAVDSSRPNIRRFLESSIETLNCEKGRLWNSHSVCYHPHATGILKKLKKAVAETPLSNDVTGVSAVIFYISGLVNADVPWALSKWDGFISLLC